jgi:hypothetical protein
VQLDAFVVMPNHVHGIIIITDRAGGVGAGFKPARTTMGPGSAAGSGSTPGAGSAGGAGSTAGPGSVGAGSVGVGSVGAGSEPAPTTTTGPGPTAGSGPAAGPGSVGAGLEPAPTRSSYGLPEIVRQFKTFSARRINELRGTPGTTVWQRNYYEHIIRDEFSLSRIRQYIAENPAPWDADQENPQRPHRARRHSLPPPHPSGKTLHPSIPRTLPAHKPPTHSPLWPRRPSRTSPTAHKPPISSASPQKPPAPPPNPLPHTYPNTSPRPAPLPHPASKTKPFLMRLLSLRKLRNQPPH